MDTVPATKKALCLRHHITTSVAVQWSNRAIGRTLVVCPLGVKTAIVASAAVLSVGAISHPSRYRRAGPGVRKQPAASTPPVCASSGRWPPSMPPGAERQGRCRGRPAAGRPAAVVVVALGLAEPDLRVLGKAAVAGSDVRQGSGSNRGSVGIFPQRR